MQETEETGRDIGYRILELESRLAAYRKVHAEELDELQHLLSELKEDVLASHGGEGAGAAGRAAEGE